MFGLRDILRHSHEDWCSTPNCPRCNPVEAAKEYQNDLRKANVEIRQLKSEAIQREGVIAKLFVSKVPVKEKGTS